MADSLLTPQILGPHPGLSIVRIWQGVVEITLRIILAVCSVCTLALPASVLSQVTDGVSGSDSLKHGSRIAGLFVICVAVLTLILETFIVVLRFLNIGAINLQMKKFFIADITVSALLVAGFSAAMLSQVVYAVKWKGAPDSCITASGNLCRDHNWWSLTAGAAILCCVSGMLALMLCIWSTLFLVRKWYYEMLQYTSLP